MVAGDPGAVEEHAAVGAAVCAEPSLMGQRRQHQIHRVARGGRGLEVEIAVVGVADEAEEWWDAVVLPAKVTEEVLLVVDEAPLFFVGHGDECEGTWIRRETVEDVAEQVVGKLLEWGLCQQGRLVGAVKRSILHDDRCLGARA